MNKLSVAFACILLYSSTVLSVVELPSISKLNPAFEAFLKLEHLPPLKANPNEDIILSSDPFPSIVHDIFNRIQTFVFKSKHISLKACDGCQAVADAATMSVYLEPIFIRKLQTDFGQDAEALLAFIIAHELSHFTYDYLIIMSSDGLSPNGNIPLLTKSMFDFVDFNQFIALTPDQQFAEMNKYLMKSAPAHSEVDLLGILTLEKMGMNVRGVAKRFLQSEVSNSEVEQSQTDFELRLKAVTGAYPTN